MIENLLNAGIDRAVEQSFLVMVLIIACVGMIWFVYTYGNKYVTELQKSNSELHELNQKVTSAVYQSMNNTDVANNNTSTALILIPEEIKKNNIEIVNSIISTQQLIRERQKQIQQLLNEPKV